MYILYAVHVTPAAKSRTYKLKSLSIVTNVIVRWSPNVRRRVHADGATRTRESHGLLRTAHNDTERELRDAFARTVLGARSRV